jgi:ABC-type multidrug transport system fused ATPase/permease subunit
LNRFSPRHWSAILAVAALIALFWGLKHARVVSSWTSIWTWCLRWSACFLAAGLLFGAVIVWWRSRGSTATFKWSKELTVAMIAALAVLVSGSVTAFVSWTGTARTLHQDSDKYFRDVKKALYFDMIKSATALGGSLDKIPRAAEQVKNGELRQIPPDLQDDLKKKRDDFQYLMEPAWIVAPAHTAMQAQAVADEASKILIWVIAINCAANPEMHCQSSSGHDDQKTVQDAAAQLSVYVQQGQWGRLQGALLVSMRGDLGTPLS